MMMQEAPLTRMFPGSQYISVSVLCRSLTHSLLGLKPSIYDRQFPIGA